MFVACAPREFYRCFLGVGGDDCVEEAHSRIQELGTVVQQLLLSPSLAFSFFSFYGGYPIFLFLLPHFLPFYFRFFFSSFFPLSVSRLTSR